MKKDFVENKKLTQNELFLLLDDILNNVLKQGKFDNNAEDFYTYKNYNLVKIMILEKDLEINAELESKIKKVFSIELTLLRKESKAKIYLGIFMIIFSIGGYFLFQNEFGKTPFFFIVSVFLFGLVLFLRGITDLRKFQR